MERGSAEPLSVVILSPLSPTAGFQSAGGCPGATPNADGITNSPFYQSAVNTVPGSAAEGPGEQSEGSAASTANTPWAQPLGMQSCPWTCPRSWGNLQGCSQPGKVKHWLWASMGKELECPGGMRGGRSSVAAAQSRC